MSKDSYIAGFWSGHDCSYCILKNGKPILHEEYERFIREKEPRGDSLKFLFNNVPSKALSKKNSDLKSQKIQNVKNVVGTCIHNKGFGTRQIVFIYLKRRQKEFIRLHVA